VEVASLNTIKRIMRKAKKLDVECGMILYKWTSDRILELNNTTPTKTTDEQNKADEEAIQNLPPTIQQIIRNYMDTVFATFEGLPPERPQDHRIHLIDPNEKPPSRPIYPLSSEELQALKEDLDFFIKQGRIRPSTSPFGAPVFYVRQKGKLRLMFDYRALNKNTVKHVAAIPNIQEMFDRLTNARYFKKFDLTSGYHQIRIHESGTHKTAFSTKYGLFEWTVMLFGLSNAPAAPLLSNPWSMPSSPT
jgi:hypothetical protein